MFPITLIFKYNQLWKYKKLKLEPTKFSRLCIIGTKDKGLNVITIRFSEWSWKTRSERAPSREEDLRIMPENHQVNTVRYHHKVMKWVVSQNFWVQCCGAVNISFGSGSDSTEPNSELRLELRFSSDSGSAPTRTFLRPLDFIFITDSFIRYFENYLSSFFVLGIFLHGLMHV